MANILGAEFRAVEGRVHLGKPALVAIATRRYDTTVEDLWDAITTPERLARWFGHVEGDFREGGRYHIRNNASGTILRCTRPSAFDLTWEFMNTLSWVQVRVAPEGRQARFTLEHIAHEEGDELGKQHFEQFGPAAGGVGWELGLYGLSVHLADPSHEFDEQAFMQTPEAKALVRTAGEGWAEADIASGTDPTEARAKAERTITFYTGG
jgi:uncharacterized protein YndB with AHSA1/START domain